MKYIKSKVKKEKKTEEPQKEKETKQEPARMTMHNITAMWKGLGLTILIAADIALIFYIIPLLIKFIAILN